MIKHSTLFALLLSSMLVVGCSEDSTDTDLDNNDTEQDGSTDGDNGSDDSDSVDTSLFATSDAIESIPLPTLGKRWVINEDYTDEFSGTELDATKWNDYHSNWAGRSPGLFVPDNLSVQYGFLIFELTELTDALRESTYNRLTEAGVGSSIINSAYNTDYTIAGAAVSSVKEDAHFGYYEARIKANQTPASTTFWLSSKLSGSNKHTVLDNQPSYISSNSTYSSLTYNEEIDILECVGRNSDYWTKYMHSNAHIKFASSTVSNFDMVSSITQQLPNNEHAYENFNIYGCWWRDKENISYYLNNNDGAHSKFTDSTVGNFYLGNPMGLNMVMETYDWCDLPTTEELTNPTLNRTYTDWVRSYILLDIDTAQSNDSENYMFEYHIHFEGSCVTNAEGVTLSLAYTATNDCTIKLMIYDVEGNYVSSTDFAALAGYGYADYAITAQMTSGESYYAVAHLLPDGYTSTDDAHETDSFKFQF